MAPSPLSILATLAPAGITPAGAALQLRPWHKRQDRRAIDRWPAPALPAHWAQIDLASAGPRVGFALDLGAVLIGRLTLRSIALRSAQLGIYLHPAHVGQGYGHAAIQLLQRAMHTASALDSLWLEVAIDNLRAIRCYQRCGFRMAAALDRAGMRFWRMTWDAHQGK